MNKRNNKVIWPETCDAIKMLAEFNRIYFQKKVKIRDDVTNCTYI